MNLVMPDQSWTDWDYIPDTEDEIEKVVTYKPNRGSAFPTDLFTTL